MNAAKQTAAKQDAPKQAIKDCLYPGRYKLPDGRTFVCEPQDVPHYAKRLRDWLAARLPVPVRWEHELATADGDAALSAADKAKNTFAHATDAVIHKDGYLEVKFPADDEDDRKKLNKVKFVSPTIKWDVVDSTGKLWPGPSITEIALTPVPIQHGQKPFTLSQAGKTMAPVFLSLADYEPIKPVRLAAGAPPMDDTEKKAGDTPPDAADDKPDGDGALPEEAEDAGLGQKLSTALQCLADHGIVLGEETGDDLETFLDHIITACNTKKAAENPLDMGGQNPGAPGGDQGSPGATEVQGPVMMSGSLAKVFRENVKLRIDNLWAKKQITKPIKDKMLAELKTVKLSMTAAGEPIEQGLLARVAAYEELPENYTAFRRDVDLSRANEVDDPDEANTPSQSEERQKKAGSELAGLANGTAKRRTNNDRI